VSFECTACGRCCTNLSDQRWVILFPSDVSRLADSFEVEAAAWLATYATAADVGIETPVPPYRLLHEGGRCVFLADDNRCRVHAVKPAQCRLGPEAFLSDSMRDYECMRGVAGEDDPAVIAALFAEFFNEENDHAVRPSFRAS
jgi:Fe-S-cluster containining protein